MWRLGLWLWLILLLGCQPLEPEHPTATRTPLVISTPRPTPRPARVSPSPEVTPTPTDQGDFVSAIVCRDEAGEAANEFDSEVDEVFVCFEVEDVPPDTMLRSHWIYTGQDAEFEAFDNQLVGGREGFFSLGRPPEGWLVGEYRVALFVGPRRLRQLSFSIKAPVVVAPETPEPTELKALARSLVQGKASDQDRALALYSWLGENVAYDVDGFLKGEYGDCSAEAVFKRRVTVCSGYANLFKAMADEVGLESEVVDGFSKGYGYQARATPKPEPDHAWNAVKIDGRWQLLDATWGAGGIDQGKFKREPSRDWFMVKPDQFIYSHYPSQPKWQLLDEPMERTDFEQLPLVKPDFFHLGLHLDSHEQVLIETDGDLEIKLSGQSDCLLSAAIEQNNVRLEGSYTLVRRNGRRHTIEAVFPRAGTYNLLVFARRPGETTGQGVISYSVQASRGAPELPKTYSSFAEHQVELIGPRQATLAEGRPVQVRLKAPGCRDVFAQTRTGQVKFESKNGEFVADFVPQGDVVTVFGVYGQGQRGEGLVEYRVGPPG
ncbi:MAG: hypothetical protein KC910_04160 [Candidatus Eremiobacteraeota bacterium]|nr:hypothetical protein [Candidatus Eremiobacteraeota bacterium]